MALAKLGEFPSSSRLHSPQDIRNQRRYRQHRREELLKLRQTLRALDAKTSFYEEQIDYYNQYIRSCLDGLAAGHKCVAFGRNPTEPDGTERGVVPLCPAMAVLRAPLLFQARREEQEAAAPALQRRAALRDGGAAGHPGPAGQPVRPAAPGCLSSGWGAGGVPAGGGGGDWGTLGAPSNSGGSVIPLP